MSRFTKDSKFRLRDFRRRKDYSPSSVNLHDALNHEYIPIHPFSDDEELLARLELSASECKSVDAWWNMGADVSLIGIWSRVIQKDRKVGIYASWPKGKQRNLYIMAVVDSETITRSLFEEVMEHACDLELKASEKLRKKLSDKLTYIGKIS